MTSSWEEPEKHIFLITQQQGRGAGRSPASRANEKMATNQSLSKETVINVDVLPRRAGEGSGTLRSFSKGSALLQEEKKPEILL